MPLQVCETFYSIMGESTLAGVPAWFIRLTGCNLRCAYCDTIYAYHGGREESIEALVAQAQASPGRIVLVTGGEPLLQADTLSLLSRLAEAGFDVNLETNGSLPIQQIDPRVRRILDLKCPGSGMDRHNHWPNLEALTPRDEVKFVVSDYQDFVWALEVVKKHDLLARVPALISPVFGSVPAREAASWILQSRLPLRLNLQLHKYIWDPEARGV